LKPKNPRTGEDVFRCPWLRKLPKKNKYIYRIQAVKPKVCREYPENRGIGEEDGKAQVNGLSFPFSWEK